MTFKVCNSVRNTIIAMLYVEGGGMGSPMDLWGVYVANSRDEIIAMVTKDHEIKGDVQDWLNSVHGVLNYFEQDEKQKTTEDVKTDKDYENFLKSFKPTYETKRETRDIDSGIDHSLPLDWLLRDR